MSTNPNNAIGTNGAYGGRTSVNAFNDDLSVFNGRGVLSGWGIQPSSGMTIAVGGNGTTRDVAVAEDNTGNRTTINNISEAPVSVTIPAAPSTNSRIDVVVAYVDKPTNGSATATDNPAPCGIIVVSGTAAATPSAPNDSAIRSAITADGGTGTLAYYAILGSITVASGTTDIDATMITTGPYATVAYQNINFSTYAQDYTITNLPTHSGGNNVYILTRVGNIVIMNVGQLWMNTALAADTTVAIGNIPAEISPKVELRCVGRLCNQSGDFVSNGQWRLSNAGVLSFSSATAYSPLKGMIGATFVWTI